MIEKDNKIVSFFLSFETISFFSLLWFVILGRAIAIRESHEATLPLGGLYGKLE